MQQDTALSETRPDRSLPLWPLDEVVRRGAQALLQRALDVEVELFLERYQYVMDSRGHRQIVRNGHRPVRRLVTGADRKSTRLNSSHSAKSRMPSSA